MRSNRFIVRWRGALPWLFFIGLFCGFFAPVIFNHKLLAPGDGLTYYLPNFFAPRQLWDPLLAAGFPSAADIQAAFWYPFSWLFPRTAGGWNLYVIAAYVLAGVFAYHYVRAITSSSLAALIGGVTYSMSGFMVAHLGHTTMIHSASWVPLILVSLEKLKTQLSPKWIVIGATAYACCFLAGHPQISFYALALSLFYAIFGGRDASIGKLKYYSQSLFALLLGCGMAAIQLIPTSELAALSLRARLDFQAFVSYSFPPNQLPTLFFPYLYGGSLAPLYNRAYFGAWPSSPTGWSITEMVGYVGFLPLMLGSLAVTVAFRGRLTRFWLGVGVVSLLLAFGDATPLIRLVYLTPGLNWFRVPARYLLITTLAISVLAGLGVAAILRAMVTRKQALLSITILTVVMLSSLLLFPAGLSLSQPSVSIPLAMLATSSAALMAFIRRSRSMMARTFLLVALILSLMSFGWFYEWNYTAPEESILRVPEHALRYKQTLLADGQRLLTIRGGLGHPDEIPPNLSKLWGIPNMSIYNPLILSRISALLSLPPHGALETPWWRDDDRSLDLLSVRYVIAPRQMPISPNTISAFGMEWTETSLEIPLGNGCNQTPQEQISFAVPAPEVASRIGLVSAMACSAAVPNGTEIARLRIHTVDGSARDYVLHAGRDSAEWAYDCNDVITQIKHDRAQIFRSYPAQRESGPCIGHDYLTVISELPSVPINKIEVIATGKEVSLVIKKVSLIDERGRAHPLAPETFSLLNPERWRLIERISTADIYENLRARPRAWIVPQAFVASPDEIRAIITTSRLPDGKSFDPATMALVESPVKMEDFSGMFSAKVESLSISPTTVKAETESSGAGLLVISDAYYPGWRANVDGEEAEIIRVNYALRGVKIPAGKHRVELAFVPSKFYLGVLVSASSALFALCLLCFSGLPSIRRTKLLTTKRAGDNIFIGIGPAARQDRPACADTINSLGEGKMKRRGILALLFLLATSFCFAVHAQQSNPPTLRIVTLDNNLPADLYYGQVRVVPIRLRPGTNQRITIDDSDFFVQQHYLDFLSRFPEPAGFNDWMRVLNSCGSDQQCLQRMRIEVSASFFRSEEFYIKGYYVYRFYTVSFGQGVDNLPEYEEMFAAMRAVTGTTGDEVMRKREEFARAWVERPDFKARYGGLSNAGYVDALLRTAGVTLSNRDQLVAALDSGRMTRAEVLRAIVESPEVGTKEYNGAFVAMQYYGYLRRKPEQKGFEDWLRVLNRNPQDYRTMVWGFVTSVEYRNRF